MRKIKSPFMNYDDFESVLVPENNGKQNPDESYMNEYQNYVRCSFSYKLLRVDDLLSKSLKSIKVKMLFLSLSLISSKKGNIVSCVMKKHCPKELFMTKEDYETLKVLQNVGFVLILS